MSTENVKILLRRGFRHELTSETLDTGEMGFTTDTNQIFVGIDSAINEIQFDPFVNAHQVIQTWLESDDCPVPGLTIDEDLVIRNIPADEDGDTAANVQLLLYSMHFFVQTIHLVGEYDISVGDTIYQRNYVYSNSAIDSLQVGKTYEIAVASSEDAQTDINDAANTVDIDYLPKHKFTVHPEYVSKDISGREDLIVKEIIDTKTLQSGIVTNAPIYNEQEDSTVVNVSKREAYGQFLKDKPYTSDDKNYYHFDGKEDGTLTSWFGLFKYDGANEEWVGQQVTNIDEATYPNDIVNVNIGGISLDRPSDALYNDTTNVADHAVVTKSSKITYWKRDYVNQSWEILGLEHSVTGKAEMLASRKIHHLPDNIIEAYEAYPYGFWKVTHIQNKGTLEETVTEIQKAGFMLWYEDTNANEIYDIGEDIVHGDIYIYDSVTGPWEGDFEEDEIVVTYHYYNDFQFSYDPPEEFTRQYPDGRTTTFRPPSKKSNGEAVVDGDYYVYVDRDIEGHLHLNMIHWNIADQAYEHNYVPYFENQGDVDADTVALNQDPDIGLYYVRPYKITENPYGILELRKRDYDTSEFWYPYDYQGDLPLYHFTNTQQPDVADTNITYAYTIDDKSDFAAGFLGRARRNVEVVTENTFNNLFADQHLTSEDAISGLRPSLFKKVFAKPEGIFLKFDKSICTTFFIDYSLKQKVNSRTYLRVGQLKVINGYPHDIPEIKLTDENTEIWHDDLEAGNDDTIVDYYDEFSNFTFDTAIEVDADGNTARYMMIMFNQSYAHLPEEQQPENVKTEVSYTIKRWTM